MSAAILSFEPAAGYAAAVAKVAAAVRRALSLGAGYTEILKGARKANVALPDRIVIEIVDFGIASGWRQ
jgi:hypothetical protein